MWAPRRLVWETEPLHAAWRAHKVEAPVSVREAEAEAEARLLGSSLLQYVLLLSLPCSPMQ